MKSFLRTFFSLTFCFALVAAYGQGTVEGVVKDPAANESLIGASILVQGESRGTVSNLDGSFSLQLEPGTYVLEISFVGYITKTVDVTVRDGQTTDLEEIALDVNAVGLQEVRVVSSMAIARQTPVAVSSVKPRQIMEKLGNQEYPEILKSTPGIYATKQGGAFGDSRVNLRGFDQRNIAVMINGVPVNDMENGWVYWSNWAGLPDVTQYMQVQRGLGAAKIAVPSVGGTINIMTRTTDAVRGGNFIYGLGNDKYQKIAFTFSTGLYDNGWASTISLASTNGDGYVDGTQFESYSYFLNISKRVNDKHSLAFSLFGAPQWHGQRATDLSIETFEKYGIRYNVDWGYKDGAIEYARKNYYHKPQAILNHFWTVNERTSLLTALYASIGTGGGTGSYGNTDKFYGDYLRNGQVDFDRIVDENVARGSLGSESILRSSVNNHNWYGVLSTLNHKWGNLSVNGGLDGRYYKGEHYRIVTDLLGGEYFLDMNRNYNKPINVADVGDKIDYYDDGEVLWAGIFAQAEYTLGNLSAFVAGSFSDKMYRRTDYFNYFDDDLKKKLRIDALLYGGSHLQQEYLDLLGESTYNNAMNTDQVTDWTTYLGFSFKGGANYNLNDNHNVFINTGFFARQPDFNATYLNYLNVLNEDARNEKVFSFELGYGLNTSVLIANLNVYYTKWLDKTFIRTSSQTNPDGSVDYFTANILGVDALHKGIELDLIYRPISKLSILGMISLADWRWLNDLEDVNLFDDNQEIVGTYNLYLADVHVGDAAQTTFALGIDYELLQGVKIGVDYNYYDRLFAEFDPLSRTSAPEDDKKNPEAWELPTFGLVDVNLRYDFTLAGLNVSFFANMNNLFDEKYISDAYDGDFHDWKSAEVYYGWGRSWSVSLRVNF